MVLSADQHAQNASRHLCISFSICTIYLRLKAPNIRPVKLCRQQFSMHNVYKKFFILYAVPNSLTCYC